MMTGHGLIHDEITEDNYVLGGFNLPIEVLRHDGQWDAYLPKKEDQYRNKLETMNCTAYGTLNCLEILHKLKYQDEPNYSERYIGVIAETSVLGNSPHKVCETVRKKGVIPEKELPFDEEIELWNEYYYPDPMWPRYLDKGYKWLQKYTFGHEWVFESTDSLFDKQQLLKQALTHSPIGISVYAWDNREIHEKQGRDNHWCTLYGYVEGEYWKIFDSYDNHNKKVAWDTNFDMAKRFYLSRLPQKKNLWYYIKRWWQEIWR